MRIFRILAGAIVTAAGLAVGLFGPKGGYAIAIVGGAFLLVLLVLDIRRPEPPPPPPAAPAPPADPKPPSSYTFDVGNDSSIGGDNLTSNADTAVKAGDRFKSTVRKVDHKPHRRDEGG